MWATAVYDLGLNTEQFYALTLAQFVTLHSRFIEAERRLDRRCARLAAVIVNMAGKYSKKSYTEGDFMPGGEEPKQQTMEEMIAILKSSSLGARLVN